MDNRHLLQKLKNIEENQEKILFYIRILAELNPKTKGRLPEILYNDQEVMFKLSWSKSTLKCLRADGLLRFRKIKINSITGKKMSSSCFFRKQVQTE